MTKRFSSQEKVAAQVKPLMRNSVLQRNRSQGQRDLDSGAECNTTQIPSTNLYPSKISVLDKQPFDFEKLKIIIKRPNQEDFSTLLDKKWTRRNIPHF